MRRLISRLLLLALPAAILVGGMSTPAVAAVVGTCKGVYRLQAANGMYVKAETGRSSHDGLLRATTPGNALGTWEEFRVYSHTVSGSTNFSLRAHNGRFVDTWFRTYTGDDYGMVKATATGNDRADQRFYPPLGQIVPGELRTIMSIANKKLIAVEENFPGDRNRMLRARTTGPEHGTWELFAWHKVRDC